MKSSVDDIRSRFDHDVERFSNLETGQSATVDAPLVMELITEAAAAASPEATHVLDIGCGAGNYTLKLLQRCPNLDAALIDISKPMLERAAQRVGSATTGHVETVQADIRSVRRQEDSVDIVLAAAVLHHLRTDDEWRRVFSAIYSWLRPGGSFWVADLIEHSLPEVQSMMWRRYGEYLEQLRDAAYRADVFAYIAQEDTPKPLLFQIDLLREVGFQHIEILHKNSVFAAFGGVK